MPKKYRVTLTAEEREELERVLSRGKADVRCLKHAQILLKADRAGRMSALRTLLTRVSPPSSDCVSALSRRACKRRCEPTARERASTNVSSTARRKRT